MSFLKQLYLWSKEEGLSIEPQNISEAVAELEQIASQLRDDPDLFDKIRGVEIDTNSEVLDLAKMLRLLNHEDEFYQEQGIELLLSYDSKEAWDALMIGALFEDGIKHSSLKLSPALRRALLQNPYYDYSDIKTIELKKPFADDLLSLHNLSELEELQLEYFQNYPPTTTGSFVSLKGIETLPKLKKFVLVLRDEFPHSFSDELWYKYLINIEEIEIKYHRMTQKMLDYQFVDFLPRLRKLILQDSPITFEKAQFKHQPVIEMLISRGKFDSYFPTKKTPLRIQKLHVKNLRKDVDLSFLAFVQVEKLILEKVREIRGISVFRELPYEPEIECIGCYSFQQSTWDDDTLQRFGAQDLIAFLRNKQNRRRVITKLSQQERLVLSANIRQAHIDIGGVEAKEVIFRFPDQDNSREERRIRSLKHLKYLWRGVQKLQFGEEGQAHKIWIKHLNWIEEYKELRELVFINAVDFPLKLLLPVVENAPHLRKILFLGGEKHGAVPKKLRGFYEYREK